MAEDLPVPGNLSITVQPPCWRTVADRYPAPSCHRAHPPSTPPTTHLTHASPPPTQGSELEGCTYKHPLYDRVSPVVIGGDYITTETGARGGGRGGERCAW